ncbi:hypothetical protein BSL78_30124, partial [Apostichopus japonicus]
VFSFSSVRQYGSPASEVHTEIKMIWGKVLHPGESLTEVVDSEIHLSMASLECRPRLSSKKDLTAHVILRTHTGEYLLCSLGYGPTPQQNLDLVLQPQEEITFSVEGSGVVYLTGYTIPTTEPVSYYGDTGFDEEAIEDCGEVPQDQEDFQQEWEVAASEGTDVTVKSEAQKEDVPQTCGQVVLLCSQRLATQNKIRKMKGISK